MLNFLNDLHVIMHVKDIVATEQLMHSLMSEYPHVLVLCLCRHAEGLNSNRPFSILQNLAVI